jgi:hypothetical protein
MLRMTPDQTKTPASAGLRARKREHSTLHFLWNLSLLPRLPDHESLHPLARLDRRKPVHGRGAVRRDTPDDELRFWALKVCGREPSDVDGEIPRSFGCSISCSFAFKRQGPDGGDEERGCSDQTPRSAKPPTPSPRNPLTLCVLPTQLLNLIVAAPLSS